MQWQIRRKLSKTTYECQHHLCLGNKCDLENERQVLFEDACNLAKDKGILAALETSAKVKRVRCTVKTTEERQLYLLLSSKCCLQESQNVEEAFIMMARELLYRNGLNVQQGDLPGVSLATNSRPINGSIGTYTPPEKKTCC